MYVGPQPTKHQSYLQQPSRCVRQTEDAKVATAVTLVLMGCHGLSDASNTPIRADSSSFSFSSFLALFFSANHISKNRMTVLQIEGERRVLAANGSNSTLATCAIRPSGIFGEGDATFFPTLVAKARQGKLKYYIGNGRNLVEFTYVGNVAQAHIEVTG